MLGRRGKSRRTWKGLATSTQFEHLHQPKKKKKEKENARDGPRQMLVGSYLPRHLPRLITAISKRQWGARAAIELAYSVNFVHLPLHYLTSHLLISFLILTLHSNPELAN